MQLANSIQDAVSSGKIKNNWILPSLHELTYHFEISKETADRGYKYLRDLGVLSSVPGKGHFVTATDTVVQPHKIFLLLDKLSAGKRAFYDVFTQSLGQSAMIDLYVYNDDFEQFKKLLDRRREGYTHYVIHANFNDGDIRVQELINALPKDKLILLDRVPDGVKGNYGAVVENLKRSIYNVLESQLGDLKKYHTIKILSAPSAFPSPDITWGFNLFCQQHGFDRSVEGDVHDLEIKQGEAFICLNDDDLVTLVEKIQVQGLQVGKDVGILSYNDTPLKKYILNGITTISTNFEQMGVHAAAMILNDQLEQVELSCCLQLRNSL